MQYDVLKMGGVLARVKVKSTSLGKIKAKQFKDVKLNKLNNKVLTGEASGSRLDTCEVLWF